MRRVRDHGLSLAFLALFLAALTGQAIAGHADYNNDQIAHMGETISLWRYLSTSSFAQAVLENWQSEFLAVGSMAVLSIFLRQRGSPESKPVGSPHEATGVEG